MKYKTTLLIIGILTALAIPAVCQPSFKLENGRELLLVDPWDQMKQVNSKSPVQIIVNPGVDYIFVLIEVPNNTAGKAIRISEVVDTPPPVTEQVDGEKATFSNNWTVHGPTTAPGWSNNTIAYSNIPGSTAAYAFRGTRIQLFAERTPTPTHGNGVVTVSKTTQVVKTENVTFKSGTTQLPVLIFDSGVLPLDNYTITLKVVTGNNLLDYFIIHK